MMKKSAFLAAALVLTAALSPAFYACAMLA